MGIEAPDIAAFNDFMDRSAQVLTDEILRALAYLGEQCVRNIRDRSPEESWFDQTANLRSSIGYAIIDHGHKTIVSAFEAVGTATEGSAKGRQLIDSLVSRYADLYALLVVAGMEYADFVEAKENKDVLANTELWARREVQVYIDKAVQRALAKILELQKRMLA